MITSMKKYMLDVEYHDEFGITCVRDVIELENDEFAFEWARLELFGENVAYKATLFNEDGCVLAEFEK